MLTIEKIKKELDAGHEVVLVNQTTQHEIEVKGIHRCIINANDGKFKVLVTGLNIDYLLEQDLEKFTIKRPVPTLKDLMIGDKVFIREDLEDEKEYEFGLYFFRDTMSIGEQVVSDNSIEDVMIEGDHVNRYSHGMIDWEKTAELNAKKSPTFDDLIDMAVKAVRDGEMHKFTFNQSLGDADIIWLYTTTDENRHFTHDQAQDGIDFINSLYTETFVIESDNDIENMRDEAKITLTNNEKGVFNITGGLRSITNTKTGAEIMGLNIFWLKGATVTQKRGGV